MDSRAPKSLDELFEAFRQSGGSEDLATRYADVPCPDDRRLRRLRAGLLCPSEAQETRWHLVYCDGCFLRAVRLGCVSNRESLEA